MKKIQLTFANEIQEAQTLIISIKKNGVASSLQEIFIEDASGAGQAERWDYGIHGNTGVYDYLANNFRTAFNRDYNTVNFNNGLTFTRVGNILNLTSTDESVIFTNASGSAIDSGAVTFVLSEPTAPPELSKRLKYWFEFKDVKEVTHRVEISEKVVGSDYVKRVLDDGGIIEAISCVDAFFNSGSVQIYGSCSLEYSETKDTLESVRGSGLKIDLDADSDLTFSDLYSEEERTYSVEYFRDGVTLFNGWLSPEGIYESLVSDKWVISLDCTDGLGFLKNLSYVEDATGLNFVGKQSLIKIVSNCLKRTKIQSKIYAGIDIYYAGLSNDLSILENVYYNVDRFVKDDNDTIMNCEEVLKSVLEPFGAVISAYKGEWLIYKPNSLVSATVSSFFGYDSSGDNLVVARKNFDFRTVLGSQINGFYPHHVNANQQKTIKSSIGAFRINYKYGLVKSLLNNPNFYSPDGFILPDWDIVSNNHLELTSNGGSGVKFLSPTNPAARVLNLQGEIIGILQDSYLKASIRFFSDLPGRGSGFTGDIKIQIISSNKALPDNSADLYYTNGIAWGALNNEISIEPTFDGGEVSLNYNITKTPQAGFIYIRIFTPLTYNAPAYFALYLNHFSLELEEKGQIDIKGENHTFQRKLKPSSKIKDVKKVFNGDSPSDKWIGTIYKADETTPTINWNRKNYESDQKPILRIMGEERMKMYGKPLQVYKGDAFGFFNYLNVATISGFNGVFMPTSYSYDCQSNVTSVTYVEILDTDILEDVDYDFTLDYGNVVEPTIRG